MEVIAEVNEISNEEFMKRYAAQINKVIDAAVDSQFDFERQCLINSARKNIMMVKGSHYNVPGSVDVGYGEMIDYLPFDNTYADNENGANMRLCPPVNKIGGNCYKFMAVMGNSSPGVKAIPDDTDSHDDIDVARNADIQVRDLWIKNRIDRRWRVPAYHQYTTGPCFVRTYWNTDAKKYGTSTEPKIEVQMDETGMPFPAVVGEEKYANGDAEFRFFSILDVTVSPFEATSLEEVDRFMLDRMRSKWDLLNEFKGVDGQPGLLDEYRNSDPPGDEQTPATSAANEAREAISNPSMSGRNRKPMTWRHHEYWLKPFLFQCIEDDDIRTQFEMRFADGLYVGKVESIIVKIDNVQACDEWAICKVGRSDRIYERPLCADGVALNLAMNDLFGMMLETVLRGIPQTLVDNTLIDRDAMATKDAVPGELILTAVPTDGNMANKVVQLPVARLGDQVVPLFKQCSDLIDDLEGVRPELSGGGPPTTTFREAKQRKDQALQQLAPQANEMRWCAADLGMLLVKLRAKYGTGTVKAPKRNGSYGKMETEIADIQQLRADGWHCESDDNFPMSMADRRDAVFSMLKEFPPEIQQALSIADPTNIEQIFDLLQVPGFESKVKDQVEKTQGDIKKLLLEGPVVPPAPPGAPPAPPQPSLPPDPWDNHVIAVGVLGGWLINQSAMAMTNPKGYANVAARWQAQQKLAVPPPPPPPPLVHTGLNVTAKLEDMPQIMNKVMEGAGLGDVQGTPGQMPSPVQKPLAVPPKKSGPMPAPGGPMQESAPIPPLNAPPVQSPPQMNASI